MKTVIKNVPIAKIKDNPWRDRVRNPIDDERVEAISASIEKTEYWLGTYGREVEGGFVELAFGHTRVEAAKRQGLKEIPVVIGSFTDGEMLVRMASENVRGELPVVVEAVYATVKAFGQGKIKLEAPSPKTNAMHVRNAPSFLSGASSTAAVEHPYTAQSIANYLGYTKKASGNPKDSVLAALDILERAELESKSAGKDAAKVSQKAIAVEKSFSSMPLKKAQESLLVIKQREKAIKQRTEKTKEELAAYDAEQRRIIAEQKARESKAEAERKRQVEELAKAKQESDAKRILEVREELKLREKEQEEKAVTDKLRIAELEAKVAETKKRDAEAHKEDEYLPIKREVERILHKLEGITSTGKEALAEEVKALMRRAVNITDRERLRQAALSMGSWYSEWVAQQFLPPISVKKHMAEYRTREEAKRRATPDDKPKENKKKNGKSK